ncbi:hypothetical protein M513_02192, partial [Trichuris suis]
MNVFKATGGKRNLFGRGTCVPVNFGPLAVQAPPRPCGYISLDAWTLSPCHKEAFGSPDTRVRESMDGVKQC